MPKAKPTYTPKGNLNAKRAFANKKEESNKRNDFDTMVNSASFVLVIGLLVVATGMVCYLGFLNRFAIYLLDVGSVLCVYAIIVKIVDIGLKIIGVRT